MLVQQFFIHGIAHSSYLLGGDDKCVIIDPARDIQVYIDAARALDMTITGIFETHLHADFISGHLELVRKTGARIYAPGSGQCAFEHTGLGENDIVELEDLVISVMETPGHTPEHISYVVTDKSRGSDPVAVFCGDTLFVGDVGRPDLFPNISNELASRLYDSLHTKLLTLPDFCEVYPAHGAGSLCGRAIGAKRTSTIGYERKYNAALQIQDRQNFIHSLTTNMPAVPDYFSRCSDTNRTGPALLADLYKPEALDPRAFKEMMEKDENIILDVRGYDAFGSQFVHGSYNNDLNGNFAVFSGWVLPPDRGILLVVDNQAQAEEATLWLRRVSLDNVLGYLDGGLFAWSNEGLPADHINQLSADEFHKIITGIKNITLLDVRTPGEYERVHIEGALNIPSPDLRTRYKELDEEDVIVVICSTGRRSSLAASILKQRNFKNVYNVAGGMTGYSAAGYAPGCPICTVLHGPRLIR